MERCEWLNLNNKDYVDYHDNEWWIPVHSDKKLFENLTLEGAQAGLSWETILKKRENYKLAFDNFDVKIISKYKPEKIEELMLNSGIVRNRLKIKSVVKNAIVFMEIQKDFWSFDSFIWSYTKRKALVDTPKTINDYKSQDSLSEKISKDLKKRGMSFVWPTIIYAFLQASWIINNHQMKCFKNPSKSLQQ